MTASPAHCSICSAPLRGDGVCLACAFQDVLASPGAVSSESVTLPDNDSAPFAALAPKVPDRIGVYALRREVARGGMGVVYEVEDTKLRRIVALKMVRGFAFAGQEDLVRFRAEAEAAAALDHPNIVPIYDVGEHDGQPYFTMKLIAGDSLAARLKAGPIPVHVAAELMVKIAHAVQHAHSRGVLHRDLKPGNILLDVAGEPWLTDFGLAKFAEADSGITVSSSQLGTPQYMSPEQAAGKPRTISTASDIWSLGVMLYQMLSGRLPFDGENNVEVMHKIVAEEPSSLMGAGSVSAKADDRDLATIVSRCLEKEPARRLQSAAFLAGELERWLDGKPIRSRPVTPAEWLWKWMRRHPYRLAGLALLALSLLAGGLTTLVQWQRAERERIAAERNAADARTARDAAAEDSYFATVANALGQRQRFDFAPARRMLEGLEPARRGFEWRLVNGLSRGDEDWTVSFTNAPPDCLALDPATGRLVVLTSDRRLHSLEAGTGRSEALGLVPAAESKLHQNERTHGFRKLSIAPDGKHYFAVEGDVLLVVESGSDRLLTAVLQDSVEAGWQDSSNLLYSGSSHFAMRPGRANAWTFNLATAVTSPIARHNIRGPFALSLDGTRMASVRDGRSVEVRSVADGFAAEPETTFSGPALKWAHQIAFSADGEHVAAVFRGVNDSTIWVHALRSNQTVLQQRWPSAPVVAFNPGGPLLLAAGREPWLMTWQFLQPRPEASTFDDGDLDGNDPHVTGGPFVPPQRLLTRSAQAGRAGFLFGHEAAVSSVLALPHAPGFLTASDDGTVRRWPLASRASSQQRLADILTLHSWYHPTASHDGQRIIYHDSNQVSHVWHRHGGAHAQFSPDTGGIAVLNDGRALARHRQTGEIICFQTLGETPAELWRTPGGPAIQDFSQIIHTAVSRDERRVAVLQPGKLLVIDLDTRTARDTPNQVMAYGTAFCQSLDLSPDGKIIAVTGFKGRRARLYSADDPAAGHTALVPTDDPGPHDSACAFSRDGLRVFVGNEDGWVRVFDVATRKEIPAERWKAQATEITAMAVSQSGDIVATAAQGTMALWSTELSANQPRRERLRLPANAARNWMQFCGDDTVLLHSAPSQPIEAWEAPR